VVKDLIEYGVVQRAIIGVSIGDVTSELAKEKDLDKLKGFMLPRFMITVRQGSRYRNGDVVMKINEIAVNSPAELQEQVGRYSPGDKINVLIKERIR